MAEGRGLTMRVLVTGAGGFAGGYVLAELSRSGHVPLALDSRPMPRDTVAVESAAADILEPAALCDAMAQLRPEACIHLAGIAFVPVGWREPGRVLRVNTIGTVNVLDAVRHAAPACRVVVVTSSLIYGPRRSEEPLGEDAEPRPDSVYAVSKLAADQCALLYGTRYGLNVMTARPSNHIGPGQSLDFAVASFASQVAAIAAGRCEPSLRVGNLESEREFADVRDVARAYRMLSERGVAGRAYNVATSRFVRMGFILERLCRLGAVSPRIDVDPALYRPTDTMPRLDTSRILADAGWKPSFSLEQTLADILDEHLQKAGRP
jgi:GDP-4-dehydro-6-deoxy-D-mannose reductase